LPEGIPLVGRYIMPLWFAILWGSVIVVMIVGGVAACYVPPRKVK
jgi:hypothetical protein